MSVSYNSGGMTSLWAWSVSWEFCDVTREMWIGNGRVETKVQIPVNMTCNG